MKAHNRLASRNLVAELIRCTNDHSAMFTFAIWSRLSPPEFPNVWSPVSFRSNHASVLHGFSFLCLQREMPKQDFEAQFRHRLSTRNGKNGNKSRKAIAFLRRNP